MANEPVAPAANAAQAMGGMMMGETSPFPSDNNLPDHGDDIASIFGLGEEAGPVPNSPEGGNDGGASPSAQTPAAEGGEGQAAPATPPTPPQPGQQGEPSPAPAPASPQPAAPPVVPVPAQPVASPDSVQALTAQVQALIAQNAQLQAQMQQGVVQPQSNAPNGQPVQQDVDPNMDYRFGIPDDVAQAIFSEDANVARNGMAHLINSMGRVIHERVLKSVQERVLPRELQNFQQQNQLTAQQESMRQEYFKAYPQHNDPGIRLVVAQEAQTMWTVNPTLQWDDNARNALGARVNARLGVSPLQQQGGLPPVAPAQPVPQPAPMMGSSNRPAPVSDNTGDFISDVLSA